MSLAWKLRRLRVMSAAEIAHRVARKVGTTLERVGVGRAAPGDAALAQGNPWFEVSGGGIDARPYVEAADRILRGQFDVFALRRCNLGFPPDWNRDPKTGIVAPSTFGKEIDYRDERLVGDVKYLWEPNRHLELVGLAQAYRLTGDQTYAAGIRELLDSWFTQCPYPIGPNWTSSLEHGIRLVNWSVCWYLVGGVSSSLFEGRDGAEFRTRWMRSVYQHCHFIRGYLSRNSSANNHLLGELAGLLIGSLTWPCWDEARVWSEFAHREFEAQALQQTHADGVNREQASWYHHSVLDMMLLAGLCARANERDFGSAYWHRVEAMCDYVASIMDVAGNVPNLGDSDDGVLVRFVPQEDFDVFGSLLATGAGLFERADLARKVRRIDDKTRWLIGERGFAAALAANASRGALPVRRQFPDGGVYVLGDGFETAEEVRIIADAGPLGYLGIAAHGHADALSFVLSVGGRAMLVDSGTYAYHTNQRWRDYFRGTAAHNTVRIDSRDQAESGGNFLWIRHFSARCLRFESASDGDLWSAEHDGYTHLADPVVHRRELRWDRVDSTLRVVDQIECKGEHAIEILWHFAAECELETSGDGIAARNGGASLRMRVPPSLECAVLEAADDEPLAWVSKRFDEKLRARVVICKGVIRGSSRFETSIEIARGR